ncbi:MAG: hypothetical protein K0R15_899 [Clostridiales bacterium]|jgi:uncharacterized protein YebE (UPF0316 family)|nr:hypothetical protein [Clostridiales bacterium]
MDFLSEGSIWIYIFIFFGKILEVTVATVRVVLINRGEKEKGSILAFFEILLWLFITGTVLVGFQDDIIRIIVFAVAFALGNYLGSILESKLAFGLCSIQVIVPEGDQSQELVSLLRANDFAVTILKGRGKDGERDLMVLHILRKRVPKAVTIIKSYLNNAVIIVNDVKSLHGGYFKK